MIVVLLAHTPGPERVATLAAKQCYSAGFVGDTPVEADTKLLEKVIASGHTSVLESVDFTFAVDGISRACSHQLVRHRAGTAFSQQSQRYASVGDEYIIPESIREKAFLLVYTHAIKRAYETYEEMVKGGVPKEDARFVLPNAATTKLVVTMNARALLHFFSLRCCYRAQWEIRELANEMLRLVRPLAPTIFKTAGAACVRGDCPEGAMGCKLERS